ncbi:MAG: hypothetical protein LQ340_004023 [Diploschistes diacapsis]|nr:MAG: hypothetical protein LQ340_004023 [Diploschistes diacapsis]
MSTAPNQSSPLTQPPHIRLNSGTGDALKQGSVRNRPPPLGNPDSNSVRSLIPQSQAPVTPGTPGFYLAGSQPSAERLLPPSSRSRTHRFRDDDATGSPDPFADSRRTSWSSEGGSTHSRIYSPGPYEDSRAPSRAGSDDENLNTQTVSEKYNILPSAGLLLFPEDVETDDYLHNPDPNDKDTRDCDIFNKRGLVNMGGLVFILGGLLAIFIAFPVLNFVQKFNINDNPCADNPNCIPGITNVPLLKNMRTGMIDPHTPDSAKTKLSVDGSTTLNLVFSDEFNTDGRTFYDGDDPFFEAVDLWYGVTKDLEWYDPDAVTTANGTLNIRMDAYQNHYLNYRSGMLQSWNKFCFQGGLMEASISLPGRGDTEGFWPGFWSMGNLGRPGYASSTDGMWPYSYDNVCDAGITPNQSNTDGLSWLPGMRLPACTCNGEDHPNPGVSRAAPELDVLEGSVSNLNPTDMIGVVSQSCQIAPFDIWYYPDYDYCEVYDPTLTNINSYTGGPFQQAASGLTILNNDWYDGNQYQTYAFEYTPGGQGSVTWLVGSEKTWTLDARSVRPNGNVGQRLIPAEPMAMILNFGISSGFAFLNFTGLATTLPATMRFDYVRIYQDSSGTTGCDPDGYPTTDYIANHPAAYQNLNLTRWSETNYSQPQNALINNCQAADSSVPIARPGS